MEVSINKQARLSEHLTSSSVATLGNSSELDCTRLSPHFTLGEMCKTSAITADGNIPSHVHIENMKKQLVRYATILLDISDERLRVGDGTSGMGQEDFDELLLERSPKGTYWLHFAVRPSENRRKVQLIQT